MGTSFAPSPVERKRGWVVEMIEEIEAVGMRCWIWGVGGWRKRRWLE